MPNNQGPAFSARTLLGFDFGLRRIGVAVGQALTQTANPLTVLIAHQGIPPWEKIDALVKEWQPDALVVGIPLNMDGTEQAFTQCAKEFANALQDRYNIPVYGVDERLTSIEARAELFEQGDYQALQKGPIDGIAARIILESWLKTPKG